MRPILLISKSECSTNVERFHHELTDAFNMYSKHILLDDLCGDKIESNIIEYLSDSTTLLNSAFSVDSIEPLEEWIEKADVAMLVFEYTNVSDIKLFLKVCRNIRVPYIFVNKSHNVSFETIGVPVTFLVEEKEKGPFASAFGRLCRSRILLFEPKDYGSKAQKNCDDICRLMSKFEFTYERVKVKKDSFKIEKYIMKRSAFYDIDLLIVSASRSYGLDDLILGPKEQHIIKKSMVPVMLINPRGDLYALCD